MLRSPLAFALAFTLGALGACDTGRQNPPGPSAPYFPQSVFWQPIAEGAPSDVDSASYIADLRRASQGGRININLTSYNVPVYTVPQGTPTVPLRLQLVTPQSPLRLPALADVSAAAGSDGHLVLLDPAAGLSFELWQARKNAADWSATVAVSFDTRGDGVNRAGTGVRASSLSLLLGLITHDEIQSGAPITHALAWAFDKPSSVHFTPPAASSDGKVNKGRATAIPAGARLQLDPALDLSTLNLTPQALRLAQALQRFGLICVDTSGDSSVVAEAVQAPRSWNGLLTENALHQIPIDRLRVLRMEQKIPIP